MIPTNDKNVAGVVDLNQNAPCSWDKVQDTKYIGCGFKSCQRPDLDLKIPQQNRNAGKATRQQS